MCKFFSGIMKYKMAGIWWDLDLDSHTDILEKFKIKDEKKPPAFVKFEMTPKDGDVFNHARINWHLDVDSDHSQDSIPEWWDRERAEDMAWVHLQEVFKERFLIGVIDDRKIEIGRWWVKDSSRVVARGSSRVEARGSSSVVARDSSSVEAWGSSSVEAWGSSRVEAWGSSSVEAWGSSSVEAWDSSRVVARDSSRVEAWGSSSVEAWDSSRVEAWGSRENIKSVNNNAVCIYEKKIIVKDKSYTLEYVEAGK